MNKLVVFFIKPQKYLQPWIVFLTRLAVGLFFAISGYYKLFDPHTHQILLDTLIKAHIPFAEFNAYFVPSVEFLGGLFTLLGLLVSPTAIVLIFLLIVAIATDALTKIPEGLSVVRWIDYFLYLPEVLFVFLLLWLLAMGAGRFSIDAKILSCIERDRLK